MRPAAGRPGRVPSGQVPDRSDRCSEGCRGGDLPGLSRSRGLRRRAVRRTPRERLLGDGPARGGGDPHPVPRSRRLLRATHPERSYAIAMEMAGPVPQGMYISSPGHHSVRARPGPDGELLLVGGEGHKVGQADEAERVARLEEWARRRFDVREVRSRWSSQDNISVDGLPYVGQLAPFSKHVLAATGFRKWGFSQRRGGGADPRRPHRRPRRTRGQACSTRTASATRMRLPRSRRRTPTWAATSWAAASSAAGSATWRRARAGSCATGRLRRPSAAVPMASCARVGALHPPRLHRRVEQRRAKLGLPLPRLSLRRRRLGAPRAGRGSAGAPRVPSSSSDLISRASWCPAAPGMARPAERRAPPRSAGCAAARR